MAISTNNQDYNNAKKRADESLHRSFREIASSSATETQFLSPALCSVSADFFLTQQRFPAQTSLRRPSSAWDQTATSSLQDTSPSSTGTIGSSITTLQDSLHEHLQRIEHDFDLPVGGGRLNPSILGPFHALAMRRYPIGPKHTRKRQTVHKDLVETVEGLTNIVFQTGGTQNMDKEDTSAKERFHNFGSSLPKKVCQHAFKRNDIVWVCRTCQADETCVLCHKCFENSHHEGHDVAFYHAQAGGCCDCGDPDAWDPKGFCPLHGKDVTISLDESLEQRVIAVVDCCVNYLNEFAENVELGYRRANNQTSIVMTRSGKRKFGRSHSTMSVDDAHGRVHTENGAGGIMERELHRYNTLAVDDHDYSHNRGSEHFVSNHSSELTDSSLRTLEVMSEHSMDVDDDIENMAESCFSEGKNGSDTDCQHGGEECKFDPTAASTSKSRSLNNSSYHSSTCSEGDDHVLQEFDPEAASTSKSLSCSKRQEMLRNMTPAQRLGHFGCQQDGLFLVLHADDVHKPMEVTDALRKLYNTHPLRGIGNLDSMCSKIVNLFQQDIGDIIIWGTYELMHELGPVLSSCWKDDDDLACTRFGALMLEKAKILIDCGMVVSIKTRHELCREVRCAAVLEFLNLMSSSCDPLCRLVTVGLGASDSNSDVDDDTDHGGDANMQDNPVNSKGMNKMDESSQTLRSMLLNDLRLPRKVAKSWHDLLLTLLAVPNFKAALANAYVDTYASVTSEYAHGIGIFEKSAYTLSVQFLNRVTYVEQLVKERDLLGCLIRSLFGTLSVARKTGIQYTDGSKIIMENTQFSSIINDMNDVLDLYSNALASRMPFQWRPVSNITDNNNKLIQQGTTARINPVLDANHSVIVQRRYGPCVSDLKCVLNVPGVARLVSSLPRSRIDNSMRRCSVAKPCILDAWINLLSICQNMDFQRWRRTEEGHVEQEPREWVGAFNAGIAIGSLYERILNWEDLDDSTNTPLLYELRKSNAFLSATELTHYILINGVDSWQCAEALSFVPIFRKDIPEVSCSNALPMSSVAFNFGTSTAMKALPISQCHLWSFHIPLHRFVAFCLREVARRPDKGKGGAMNGVPELLALMKQKENFKRLFRIYSGLLEYPLMIVARNSQIRSDLWLRNGRGMFDQVLNYAEPHFCKGLRDADLSLIQFAFIGLTSLNECENTSAKTSCAYSFSCAHLVNLFLNRFGIFDYVGFRRAPEIYHEQYLNEVRNGFCPAEKQLNEEGELLPMSYAPSDDPIRLKSMLEELLHTLIILITELFAPPPVDSAAETLQAKSRLRREVVHRLASGPKAHSELAEIHHVLSMRDNLVLSEEGKLVNPDDANGAALEAVLVEVADCKSFQGRSDKWELQRWAWNEYDPAFFHLSTAQHQNASENRPIGSNSITPIPYAPFPPAAHTSFSRLRRDITSDACVVAIIYRALHVHCRTILEADEFFQKLGVNQQQAYMPSSYSEMTIGRAIHLLTLGAYAWETELPVSTENWKAYGGGDSGSLFHDFAQPPTQRDWIEKVLLADPHVLMDLSPYNGEKNILQLLRVLVTDGGSEHFKVQDKSIRCGAAWLIEYATRTSSGAATLLGNHRLTGQSSGLSDNVETHKQRRSREAKERAMKLMQLQMAKFANTLENDETDGNSDFANTSELNESESLVSPRNFNALPIDGLENSGKTTPVSSEIDIDFMDGPIDNGPCFPSLEKNSEGRTYNQTCFSVIPRLLNERPKCIICADDGTLNHEDASYEFENDQTNKPKKKVLAWCGYIQASTVAKGGGAVSIGSIEQDFHLAGTHISSCGHAVHISCCDAHAKDSLQREGDIYDRYDWRGEFKCPLCRRISNCLVPFIDVCKSWADLDTKVERSETDELPTMHDFLSNTKWWTARNDSLFIWNGRCSFVPRDLASSRHSSSAKCFPYGKKELCKAWGNVLWTPPSNQHNHSSAQLSTAMTAAYRKILDQISEISYKADSKRIGEDALQHHLGEYRHYLVEKVMYNDERTRSGSMIPTEWPSCIIPAPSQEQRQALSREKLISKHLLAIQALTYSCCSEILECIRLAKNSTSSNLENICLKFGVQRFTCNGNFLILPTTQGKGVHIFDGKIGRLRYLALTLIMATSPISKEVVHLSMSMPVESDKVISVVETSSVIRAPIVYPILCGHVLTHVVATVCAICGQERVCHEATSTLQSFASNLFPTLNDGPRDMALTECIHFIQLGYIARTLQVLLGILFRSLPGEFLSRELQIISMLQVVSTGDSLSDWEKDCHFLLRSAFTRRFNDASELQIDGNFSEHFALFSKACQKARELSHEYICSAGIIFQIILPRSAKFFQSMAGAHKMRQEDIGDLLDIFGISDLNPILVSSLTREVVEHWYEQARPIDSTGIAKALDAHKMFRVNDWPHVTLEPSCNQAITSSPHSKKYLPLLGGNPTLVVATSNDTRKRITSLPVSYTDLYAKLGAMLPDCELTAVCFVCGEVLDAGGKGECTRHAHQCGVGCGIFFLLQECICLGMHRDTAAYITSPYVDSHGETPQYRGRPLNMDESRYEFLHELWSGHLLREYVIAERSKSMRNLLISSNFY